MCFTPTISLATAITEWVLALILITSFRKSKLTPYFSIILMLLGIYQFTEFMLCFSANLIWVRVGFIAYSFLPVLGLHATLFYLNKRKNFTLLYAIPIVYSFLALLTPNFVLSGTCMRLFVSVKTILSNNALLVLPYMLYYIIFITIAFIYLVREYLKVKDKTRKKVSFFIALGIFCMTLPTFIVLQIFPIFNVNLPSVLCHFALLLAIIFFIAASLDSSQTRK